MHREVEDTSAPGDIPDGLDNKWGGGLAARVDHRPICMTVWRQDVKARLEKVRFI